jgi:ribosomal protein S18 acetylase RimI-like enzyme
MQSHLTIRPMHPGDLTFAVELTSAEGWVSEDNQTFEGFYQHDPNGFILAEQARKPLGICIATSYGSSGFIGELIVHPDARGIGIGTVLLIHAVNYLHQCRTRTIYLDGVPKAIPLYERNGFHKVYRSYRLSGTLIGKTNPQVRAMQVNDLPAVCDLDRQAFGADRGFFLARRLSIFPELSQVLQNDIRIVGFIMGRRGQGWVVAGPRVVAPDVVNPLPLLESLADVVGQVSISIGILSSNTQALETVHSLGFTENPNSPWRMALGPDNDLGASNQCIAVGSAAKG